MRFAVRLAYNGGSYSGWQSQDNANTIQGAIEAILYKKIQKKIDVLGCGRTDKGVHANDFLMHFDFEEDIRDNFVYNLNKMLPNDIAIYDINIVSGDFHARFDALSRSYIYKVHTIKSPFKFGLSYYFPRMRNIEFNKMQEAVSLLLEYDEFFPFCKTNTDVKTMICDVKESFWQYNSVTGDYDFLYKIQQVFKRNGTVNSWDVYKYRFRKLSLYQLKFAMDNQIRLDMDWSVPAHGLYLDEITY